MTDVKNLEQYQISEADIDKVIAYLKTIDPEKATPENAISFLEDYAKSFHELGHVLSDDELKELYDKFKNNELDS